jgi:cell division initiation protein
MKLTPLDIRHKEFKRGMRGYVDGEVDEFLDEIADEFERLFKENIELSERGEALQEKIDQYRNLEETLQNTLVAAQRSAEELRANAQKEAQLMLSEAELKARQMVNESYADKQAVEKQIVVLRSSEEDFRFKFRSLLEGYTNQLAEAEAAAKKSGHLAPPNDEIKQAMAHDAASRPGAPTPTPPPPLAARPPAPTQATPAARP